MEAGRKLDALVAEKVMGLPVEYTSKAWSMDDWLGSDTPTERDTYGIAATDWKPGASYPRHSVIPRYSTDIAAAWQVVEHMNNWYVRVAREPGLWHARFVPYDNTAEYVYAVAKTAPLAICLAALKAIVLQTEEHDNANV